jgi:hypothetical protein
MRFAFWISKAIDTHSEYVILTALPRNNDYEIAPQYYVSMCNACLANTLYVTKKIVESALVVTSVSILTLKFVDGKLQLFMVKQLKNNQNVISTGTMCASCVVEISHVFHIYFGRCAGTCTCDITSFSSVIKQKAAWQDIYQQSWPANILCRSLTAADIKSDAKVSKRHDHFVLAKGLRLT